MGDKCLRCVTSSGCQTEVTLLRNISDVFLREKTDFMSYLSDVTRCLLLLKGLGPDQTNLCLYKPHCAS